MTEAPHVQGRGLPAHGGGVRGLQPDRLGLAEEVYQQCLEFELELREIPFTTKRELALVYKGRQIEKRYVPDLFVFDAIVVELKAVKELIADREAQLFNRIAQQPVGYLINFGSKDELEWKRFILSDVRGAARHQPSSSER